MPDLAERATGRWADLGIRALSGAVLVPVGIVCIWLGGEVFTALVAAGALGLALEWLALCRQRVMALLRLAGFLYIGLAGAALLWLRHDPVAGRADVLFLVAVVCATDIGAYLIGRWLGGPRLAPRISPGKTWSGAFGGLSAAVVIGVLVAHLQSDATIRGAVTTAAMLGAVAQAGDLLESYVKRRLQVKDSSHLIPGHGGLFDRLDSLLAAAPVAALLALTQGRGVVLWQ